MTTHDSATVRAAQPIGEGTPKLRRARSLGRTRAVVLLLHGGSEASLEPVTWTKGSWLRMRALQSAIAHRGEWHGVETCLLRYRVRGWNAGGNQDPDPVRDARWALAQIRGRHPGLPIVLVGHSMGGRTACRIADEVDVVGVCALAPWLPPGEPVDAVRNTALVIAHGTADTWTSVDGSLDYARRARAAGARVARFEIADAGHFMVGRAPTWHRLARDAALGLGGVRALPAAMQEALSGSGSDGLRVPIV